MNDLDRWRSKIITSPEKGLYWLLTMCLDQAEKQNDENAFYEVWVKPQKLNFAWDLLRDFDPRYDRSTHESDYHVISRGNEEKISLTS